MHTWRSASATPEKNTCAPSGLLFHTTFTSLTSERRRAILSYRRTCRRGATTKDRFQQPAMNSLKGEEEPVREGRTQHRRVTRGRATWDIYEMGKEGGLCVACRLSSSYISLEIPALLYNSTLLRIRSDAIVRRAPVRARNGSSGTNSF